MPELPDVEVLKRYIKSTSLGRFIEGVEVRDLRVTRGVSARRFRYALRGRSIVKADRHGKYLFAGVSGGSWLVMHFGMSGSLSFYSRGEEEPGYTRLVLKLSGFSALAYTSVRRLGFVSLVADVKMFIDAKGIGPDALVIDKDTFVELFRSRKGFVKSALMDQRVLAGLGNIYSDEVLFQSGIHPGARIEELGRIDLERLFRKMKHVLDVAIDRRVKRFPGNWLIQNRSAGATCKRCGSKIAREKLVGRSSYFCPRCQEKGLGSLRP